MATTARVHYSKLALLIVVLAFAKVNATENLGNLISDARVLALDASSASRQRFTDAQITQFINVGQTEAMIQSHCLLQSTTFTLTPGATYYPLPTNFLSMNRVTIGKLYATEMTPASLDGRSRGWEAASGHPTYYFIDFATRGVVGFTPWPATLSDIDTIKLEYYVQAKDLANNTDVPFNGINELNDYHHSLAYFAASLMTSIDGWATQAQTYMALFTNSTLAMKNRCTERPNYLPSAAGTP